MYLSKINTVEINLFLRLCKMVDLMLYFTFMSIKHIPHTQQHSTARAKSLSACDREEGICVPSLLSHVEQNDYFGTLATVLNFVREGIHDNFKNNTLSREHCIHILECMRDDLRNLQDRYDITKRGEDE